MHFRNDSKRMHIYRQQTRILMDYIRDWGGAGRLTAFSPSFASGTAAACLPDKNKVADFLLFIVPFGQMLLI